MAIVVVVVVTTILVIFAQPGLLFTINDISRIFLQAKLSILDFTQDTNYLYLHTYIHTYLTCLTNYICREDGRNRILRLVVVPTF